ncbi:HET-domain-containing protein [Pyrenochaeta sp. DS3sAY3a]|nr:HET-domain-containing protein [Pyrenochaeta sp. DS3sAY3a]
MDLVNSITDSIAAAVNAGYPKLQNADSQIRLLRLLPAHNDEPLSVELFVPDMENLEHFVALSYCWGTKLSTEKLSVNDTFELSMTENLEKALRNLRGSDAPTTIWIDAICINQQSIEERNQQVKLMNAIYSSASSVIVWLGLQENDSEYVFEILQKNMFEMLHYLEEPRFLHALHHLCSRAWFSRVWVVQEVSLAAKDPVIRCGEDGISWSSFTAYLDYVQIILSSFHFGDGREGQTVFGRGDHEGEITRDERTSLVLQIDHILFLRDVRVQTIENLNKMLAGSPDQELQADYRDSLATNMHRMHFTEATNPRDKIYGLLGISAYPHPNVDYACEVRDLFTETMMNIIRHSFLHSFSAFPLLQDEVRPSGWPSWVPDFAASPERCRAMANLCPLEKDLQKMLDEAPWPKGSFPVAFMPGDTMVTTGPELGTVVHVVETLGWPDLSLEDIVVKLGADIRQLGDKLHGDDLREKITASTILDAVGASDKLYVYAPNREDMIAAWDVLWANDGESKGPRDSPEKTYLHQILSKAHRRDLGITDTGRLIACPVGSGVKAGDVVAGLFGLQFPMVMRPSDGGSSESRIENVATYAMVSITHVSGHQMRYTVKEDLEFHDGEKVFAIN